MALLFRFSRGERVLRSVGDTPGIVCVGNPPGADGFTVYVDPRWAPSPRLQAARAAADRAGGPTVLAEVSTDAEQFVDVAIVSVEEAVAACPDFGTLAALLDVCMAVVPSAWEAWGSRGRFEIVRDACEWLIEVRAAAGARRSELEPDGGC